MLKAGIVGLPNVGKSTLFNALTRSRKAEAANYPFCTIEPNVGVVEVPDDRLKPLAEISKTNVIIPAAVEFVDIAGLVAGASKGEGLGNKFLANIREVDAIVHVVRCFDDDDILHNMGSVDPVRDIEIITTELVLSDLQSCEKQLESNVRKAKGMDKEAIKNVELLTKLVAHLDSGKPAITLPDVSDEDAARIKSYFLLTSKPVIYACNVGESDIGDGGASNGYVAKVREFVKSAHDADSCVICARLEEELSSLEPAEAKEYLSELGASDSGVSELIKKNLRPPRARQLLHRGRKGSPRVDVRQGHDGPPVRRRNPHGLRTRIHQGGSRRVRRPDGGGLGAQGARGGHIQARGQRLRLQGRRRRAL